MTELEPLEIEHGGNINCYYDDSHDATGCFDLVLANPPFNVNAVDIAHCEVRSSSCVRSA